MDTYANQQQPITEEPTRTILLIANDCDHGEAITYILSPEAPYQVLWMENCAETMQRVHEIKVTRPILLILDYYLSSMSGLKLYDQLCAVEGLEHLPVLIMTADLPKTIEREVEQRGFPILRKPFDIDDLLHRVEQMIT